MPGRSGAMTARTGPRVPVGNARRASPLSGAGSLRLPGQAYEAPARGRAQGEGGGGGDAEEAAKRAARRQFYKSPSKPSAGAGEGPGKGPAGAPRKPVKSSGPGRG
jgi:23S rRNA (adenine2030-N6)-methyltransferase